MIKPSNFSSRTETDTGTDKHHRIDSSSGQQELASTELTSGHKKLRRRHIDPTTCERDYTIQEREFMLALDDYKRASGRMFPTCSEILEVIRNLGYVQYDLPTRSDEQTVTDKSELLVG